MVAMVLPRLDLTGGFRQRTQAPGEALAIQHAEFTLSHIQRTPMLWSRVNCQLACQSAGFGRREHLIEGGGTMRVQVIHHQYNLFCGQILLFKHLPHELGPLSPWRTECLPPTHYRLFLAHTHNPAVVVGLLRQTKACAHRRSNCVFTSSMQTSGWEASRGIGSSSSSILTLITGMDRSHR